MTVLTAKLAGTSHSKIRLSSVMGAALTWLVAFHAPCRAQDAGGGWVKLSTVSADNIEKLPEWMRQALASPLSAYREKWERALPLIGASGKPLPRRHNYISPTIAWAQLQVGNKTVGLSLSDSECSGPNSATSDNLYICNAVLSINSGNGFRNKPVSLCYAGQTDDSANEIAYNKERNVLDYRVIVPDVKTDYCFKSLELD